MIVELENPAKAALISAMPKITSNKHARSGGAPNGSLSCMIRMTMRTVIAIAIIICVVILFLLHSLNDIVYKARTLCTKEISLT